MPRTTASRSARLASTILPLALTLGCQGSPTPEGGAGTLVQPLIMDQLHNGGTEGFMLLPPMVPRPAHLGDIVPALPVTVRVDEIRQDGSTIRSLATFTDSTGPRGERLRYHIENGRADADDKDGDNDPTGYYLARWKTGDENLSLSALYRVRVLVPDAGGKSRELGFADVDVVRNQKQFRSVDTENFTPLIDGETLRIKFRVDRPAVDADADGILDWKDNCPRTANADQTDSLKNGIGDACRCDKVVCSALDTCHGKGVCNGKSGTCDNPALVDGTECPISNAKAVCSAGTCKLVECLKGFEDLNGKLEDGCEHGFGGVDCSGECTQQRCSADVANCGACGNVCAVANGAPACVSGKCELAACNKGFADCNKLIVDGCESDLLNDVASCGACNNKCVIPNGTPVCSAGLCKLAVCDKGFADCDGTVGNGCEVNTNSDVKSCGGCGRVCVAGPGSVPFCKGGTCAIVCLSRSLADCDGKAVTGCEVDLSSDGNNCGACGVVCGPGSSCVAGACTAVVDCLPGTANCNGNPIDKCEVQIWSDANNCGACGTVCQFDHAFPSCVDANCGFSVCENGWADCDGVMQNGCEVAIASDGSNCGGCGVVCGAGSVCDAGVCTVQVASISKGVFAAHSCAVLAGGAVKCWGFNNWGQVGDGTTVDQYTPTLVAGLPAAKQVATGTATTCALLLDGTVRCWGLGNSGQLGAGPLLQSLTPQSVLTGPGTTLDHGVEISSGAAHSCARLDDGTLRCWGFNSQGQIGDGTNTQRAYATTTTGLSNVISVSGGYNFTCAALGDGSGRCWGYGPSIAIPGALLFQTTPLTVPGLVGAVEVGSGEAFSCARLLDGTVRCWGDNQSGQLGDGTNVDRTTPVTLTDDQGGAVTTARELAVASSRVCVRLGDGSARCAGGLVGDGTFTSRNRAVHVLEAAGGPIVKGVVGLGSGAAAGFLVRQGGALGWWRPSGDGTNTQRSAPVPVLF